MSQLRAMREAGIKIDFVDDDADEVHFMNGITLPIIAFWSPDRSHRIDDPVDGGWIEFGDDEIGYGWYPCKLITEEEYDQERRARARAAVEESARQARPI